MVEESFNTADQTRSFDFAQDDKKKPYKACAAVQGLSFSIMKD